MNRYRLVKIIAQPCTMSYLSNIAYQLFVIGHFF
jgi:hypothetical protein